MGLFRRSLSEDSIDRYNHVWSVCLLLALALTSWILPFSPAISSLATPKPVLSSSVTVNVSEPKPPTYKASCWTPSEFTGAQVLYVQNVCAGSVNTAMKTGNASDSVYHLPMESLIPLPDRRPVGVRLEDVRHEKDVVTLGQQGQRQTTGLDDAERYDTYFFVAVTIPLALFMFAICLKLPYLLWCLMSTCGAVNVDQTLKTVHQGLALDVASRRQLNSDLSRAAKEAAGSSRSLGVVYLTFKFLTCVVVLTELVGLAMVLLPELNQLKEGNSLRDDTSPAPTTFSKSTVFEYENAFVSLCAFEIRQLQRVNRYTIQCVFSLDEAVRATAEPLPSDEMKRSVGDVLLGYEALLTAVLAYLVILLVVDVLSLVVWLSRLVIGTCRDSLTDGSSLSLDLNFLLLMSKENSSPLFTKALGRNLASAADAEGEPLKD